MNCPPSPTGDHPGDEKPIARRGLAENSAARQGDEGEPAVFDPTIADVHPQPTDEGGAVVGKVLVR